MAVDSKRSGGMISSRTNKQWYFRTWFFRYSFSYSC